MGWVEGRGALRAPLVWRCGSGLLVDVGGGKRAFHVRSSIDSRACIAVVVDATWSLGHFTPTSPCASCVQDRSRPRLVSGKNK